MSTKPIREALERLQCTCRDHSCVGCRAEAAVSVIERAAKMHTEFEWMPDSREWLEIRTLMQSIAKDAP